MIAVLAAYLLTWVARLALVALNLDHMQREGHRVPPGFEGVVDEATLARSARYTRDRERLGLVRSAMDAALVGLFFFGGWLGVYDRWLAGLAVSPLARGVLFFLLLHWAQTAVDLPFRWYGTFRLEARHGFNTTTPALWVADGLKAEVIGSLLLAGIVAACLALVRADPVYWWLWVWAFLAALAVFLLYLSPVVIAPLFFRFEPVRAPELAEEIRALLARAGLRVRRVLQVDASRRSRHTNAYFTGIGRVKRIVLFDTLFAQLDRREILAVLAHEAGHWVRRHVPRRLALSLLVTLGGVYLAHRLLPWAGLPPLVGLAQASLPARALILLFLASVASFPLTPLANALSRRHEREADRFAADLTGAPEDLAAALAKLSRDNLANLHPHPLYAWVYAAHPPVARRVASLLAEGTPGKARRGQDLRGSRER